MNEYNVKTGDPVTCTLKGRQMYGHVVRFTDRGTPVARLHTGEDVVLPNCWICYWGGRGAA